MSVKESKEFVGMIVQAVKSVQAAKAEKFSIGAIVTQLVTVTPAVVSGFQGAGNIDDELKAIDEAGIKELAAEAMLILGDSSEKTKTIVEQSIVIILAAFKLYKA